MTGSGIQEPFCFVPEDHPGAESVQMAGEEKKENSLFERLKKGLGRTRRSLVKSLDEMVFGEKVIERDLFEEIEENLIAADVGAAFTQELIGDMKDIVKRKDLSNPEILRKILRDNVAFILKQREAPLDIPKGGLFTIMVVGVNGTGKTTTIGKMAMGFKARGYGVMLAAADTFRAAAIEQLDVWSQRCGVPMIRQQMGADPSAVVFDALHAARAKKADVLIIDTAGRLHTKVNLMEELKKVKRIMGRELPGAPHEILLVLDATTGQNALAQARMFDDAVGVTGIVLTKLDGTAKGGIIIRIARELQIPIRFIGIGEAPDDLRVFNSVEYTDALFA
jgi:fused signal recognition particle receptor